MMTGSDRRRDLHSLLALLLICGALFFFGLGDRPIWDTDEGMHAATSRTMVETGDWLSPEWNGAPFYDKPPFFNWLVAISFSIFGFTEFAARLPSALAALATVLLTWRYGRLLVGERAAFLGAIVLATSLEFVVLARVVVHDIVLTLFVTLACLAFRAAYADRERRTVHALVMHAAVGLAVLAKGPVGAVLPALAILGFLVARRDLSFVRRLLPVRGALLAAAIAVPTYAALALRDPGYLRYFFLEKNFGSMASADPKHAEPFWFYVPVLLAGLFPWSAFLPAALWPRRERDDVTREGRAYLVVWFAVVLGLFSIASSKLPTYVLPLFPAAALLIGEEWSRRFEAGPTASRKGLVVSYAVLGAVVAWIVWTIWTDAREHRLFDPVAHTPHLVAVSAFLVAVTVLGALFLWRRADRALFATTATFVGGLVLYLTLVVGPIADSYRSSKEVAKWIDGRLPGGETVCFYPKIRDSVVFYTGRLAEEPESLDALARRLARPGAMCVVDADWLPRLEPLAGTYRVVHEYGNKLVIEGVAAADVSSAGEPLTSD